MAAQDWAKAQAALKAASKKAGALSMAGLFTGWKVGARVAVTHGSLDSSPDALPAASKAPPSEWSSPLGINIEIACDHGQHRSTIAAATARMALSGSGSKE
jgi:hypothetical protein